MRYLKKEIKKFNLDWQSTLKEVDSEKDNRAKQYRFDSAIKDYETANSGFILATVFTLIISLFSLKLGIDEAVTRAIFLLGVPYAIAHIHVSNKKYSVVEMEELYPIPIIEKKTEFWNLFATATWSIVVLGMVVFAILNWGTFEGIEPPY